MNCFKSIFFVVLATICLYSCSYYCKTCRFIAYFTTENGRDTFSVGETIIFYDSCQCYNKSKPMVCTPAYRFGDGKYGSAKLTDTISHIYQSSGKFVVRVEVGAIEGPGADYTKEIVIIP
jgi:hypothetical protein